jgi:hypothetical protein
MLGIASKTMSFPQLLSLLRLPYSSRLSVLWLPPQNSSRAYFPLRVGWHPDFETRRDLPSHLPTKFAFDSLGF